MDNYKDGKFRQIIKKIPSIVWVLLVAIIFLGMVSPNSVKPAHLLDFTRQGSILIVAAMGQTIVMAIGGIDLSVGAVISLTTILVSEITMGNGSKTILACIICILVGCFIGLVNGVLSVKFRLPSFIVTLGMKTFLFGFALIYCSGAPRGFVPQNLRFWANGFLAGIPCAAYVWVLIALLVAFVIYYTRVGRYIFSTGTNEQAVKLAGVDTQKVQIACYVGAGLLAALAGLIMAAYIGVGSITSGDDYQMNSITAAILGGATFTGGKGSIVGTIVASLFMMVLFSLIAALNMDIGSQTMITGVVIILGILMNNIPYLKKYFRRTSA